MTEGTEQHLEHAEHAQHAAFDPFNKRVAMTMAITAAVLAFVAMLSHRAHNKTLQLQILATDQLTAASNKWNHFQSKKNRLYLYEADRELAGILARSAEEAAARGRKDVVRQNHLPADRMAVIHEEVKTHDPSKDKGQKPAKKKRVVKPLIKPKYSEAAQDAVELAQTYDKTTKVYTADTNKLQAEAEKFQDDAQELREQSHHVHEQANRLDFGHLGLEMALVLCSVALLSRQAGFWYTGIGAGILGLCVSLSAYLMH
jgi:hypothetical protein